MRNQNFFWFAMVTIGVGCVILMWNDEAGQSFGIPNEGFARLIWLGTMGVVIGAGVFARGRPTGHIVRQMAIWLVIFLAAMVAYQFAQRYGLLPSDGNPPASGSGAGSSASLVDRVDRILHL